MANRSPTYNIKDFAEYLKVPPTTLHSRLASTKNIPAPIPCFSTLKSHGKGKHSVKFYELSVLLKWHRQWETLVK